MGVDDDIAAQLPEPPPPAPLPRRRAIDAALRRFDAAHGVEPAAEPANVPRGRSPWWRIGRPQAAALVTGGLILLFGVPAAWLSVNQRATPVVGEQLASTSESITDRAASAFRQELPSGETSAPPRPTIGAAPLAERKPEQPTATVLAKDEARENEEPATAKAAAAAAAPVELARAEPVPSAESPVATMAARQAYAARTDRPVHLADAASPPAVPMAAPPPPPPPPMIASANADAAAPSNFMASAGRRAAKPTEPRDMVASAPAASGNIVVTAARRVVHKPAGRGDWNACTINDPAHSLVRCRGQLDPAAPGPTGRAAAHVADGLMRAWQGDLDGAISDFDRAIATAPRYAPAYLNRGLALQRKGEFSRAAADLDQAVRHAPGAARGYYSRAQLLRERGEADRADADEDRAVALDPGYEAVVE